MDEQLPTTEQGPEMNARPVVVVGLDGSDHSSAALRWAAEEVRLRSATLTAVSVWHVPTVGYMAIPVPVADMRTAAEEMVDKQIATVLGSDPGIEIQREIREGPPAMQLLEAAKDATLIVVGSRGRGGFSGLVLGSVSAQVAHHAACPVTIVPR